MVCGVRPVFSPPLCRRERAEAGIGTVETCSLSAEGTRRARDRTAQPADPVPPAEHRSPRREAQAASFALQSGGAGSGDQPDKAGATGGLRPALFVTCNRAKGTNHVYHFCT